MQFSGSAMTPPEAEIAVRGLQAFTFDGIGSEKWKDQRDAVEQLNMCTHSSAVSKVDDCVKSFLIDHEKLPVLLHELLLMEAWRQKVVGDGSEPSARTLVEAIAASPTAPYMYCTYESVLVNLFECICFHEEVVTGFGDDVLELIDYCWRQVSFLFSLERELAQVQRLPNPETAEPVEKLLSAVKEQRISRALSCISLLWFIVDRLSSLPLSVSNSVLNKNDLLVGMSEVLVLQPWQRRVSANGDRGSTEIVFQKFKAGSFTPVSGDGLLEICTPEAHAWFCIHKLLCDPELRRRYPYTTYKKEIILRIRRFMYDTLMDQIPALQSVQRALEELSFLEPPSGTEEKFKSNNLIIIEQVPRHITAVMASTGGEGWEQRERERLTGAIRDPCKRVQDAMRMARIFDQMFAGQM